jgi:hypothetical protein
MELTQVRVQWRALMLAMLAESPLGMVFFIISNAKDTISAPLLRLLSGYNQVSASRHNHPINKQRPTCEGHSRH